MGERRERRTRDVEGWILGCGLSVVVDRLESKILRLKVVEEVLGKWGLRAGRFVDLRLLMREGGIVA